MGQLVRLCLGEAFDERQALGGVLVFVEAGEVLGRGDDGDVPIQAAGSLADFDEFQLVGGLPSF